MSLRSVLSFAAQVGALSQLQLCDGGGSTPVSTPDLAEGEWWGFDALPMAFTVVRNGAVLEVTGEYQDATFRGTLSAQGNETYRLRITEQDGLAPDGEYYLPETFDCELSIDATDPVYNILSCLPEGASPSDEEDPWTFVRPDPA